MLKLISGFRMRRWFFLLFFCLGLLIGSWTGVGHASETHHLVVLYTNDTHGHPVKFQYGRIPDVGGLPARATMVKQIRKENPNVLLLDAGDLNTGSAESDLFEAEPDIIGYNYIGYDAMAIGNHEFDHPIATLKAQMARARFPFLSANVKTRDNNYLGKPYLIKKFDGFKAAVLGLTTSFLGLIGNPKNIGDIVFQDEVETARALVPALRKEADIVIALTHIGTYGDDSKGSRRLAAQVGGLDLIVDGHTHTRLDRPIVVKNAASGRDTLIVQAWEYGMVLGRIDLWIHDRQVVNYRMELIPINFKRPKKSPDGSLTFGPVGPEIEEDPDLLGRLQPYVDRAEALLSEEIGYAEKTFWNRYQRKEETALGDLVADSVLWYMRDSNPDFAFINGGAIRADILEGLIKKKTIFDTLPFDSTAVVLTLKGKEVQVLFDHAAAVPMGSGGFLQVSRGVSLSIDHARKKYTHLTVHGQPIDPEKTYRIATNSYLAAGGDGYRVLLNGTHRIDSATPQKEVLVRYIQHLGGRIRPCTSGRIRIISGADAPDPAGSEGLSTDGKDR